MNDVKISVVLPVYNGESFLAEAIESVLNQSHSNLELILIDDGSSDNSLSIIRRYEKIDTRVRVYSRENKGLVVTLNEGVSLAQGNYIARMDADDICYPSRFKLQLIKMLENDLDIIGGAIDLMEENRITKTLYYRETSDDIKASILTWGRNFCHPSVMARKSLYEKYPYEEYPGIEDFVLWIRLALDKKIKLGNLMTPVIKYRIHSGQVTQTDKNSVWHHENQLKTMQDVVSQAIPNVDNEEIASLERLLRSRVRYVSGIEREKSLSYIDTLLFSDALSAETKRLFLSIISSRIHKRSRPKNKFFILRSLRKRLKNHDATQLVPVYHFNE